MKLDKVVFGCSEAYSPWWNIQSKIWRTKFNVEPICLLFGDKNKCGMSEEYGRIEEMQFDPDLPDIIQIQFCKFFYPNTEPDKTWIIGDIDQIPLQTDYILNSLTSIPDDAYAHLNYTGIAQMLHPSMRKDGFPGLNSDAFVKLGPTIISGTAGFNLPGHYHVAKGHLYKELFFKNKSFKDVIKSVMESKRYGITTPDNLKRLTPNIHGSYWVAEEFYTSEQIWYGIRNKKFNGFYGKEYHMWNQKIDRIGNIFDQNGRWLPQWNGTNYIFNEERLRNNGYMDLHCHRPYHEQEQAMMQILTIANMI